MKLPLFNSFRNSHEILYGARYNYKRDGSEGRGVSAVARRYVLHSVQASVCYGTF